LADALYADGQIAVAIIRLPEISIKPRAAREETIRRIKAPFFLDSDKNLLSDLSFPCRLLFFSKMRAFALCGVELHRN